MATSWATPEALGGIASSADAAAADLDTSGNGAGNICAAHGYWYAATASGGAAASAARWARKWAESLRQRQSLLEQYDVIALLGSAAAAGAGRALGAAKAWALTSPGTLSFEEWYRVTVAAAVERQRRIELGRDLATRFQSDELLNDPLGLAADLEAAPPEALVAFFEALGIRGTVETLRWIYPLDSMSWALPDALDESVANALQTAWADLDESFRLGILEGEPDWAVLYHTGLLGRFEGEFWGLLAAEVVGEGPRSDYARNPTNSLYSYGSVIWDMRDRLEADQEAAHAFATAPQLWLARGAEDEFPLEPWIAELISAQIVRLDDDGFVDFAEEMLLAMAAMGGDAIVDVEVARLSADLVTMRDLGPAHEEFLAGVLVLAAGTGGVIPGLLEPLATLLVTHLDAILPAATGFDVANGAVFTHPASAHVVPLTEADFEAAMRYLATDEAAMATVLEGVAGHFGSNIELATSDADLQVLAMELGAVSGLVVRAINDASIDDARTRDESRAAVLGVIALLVAAIPVPGAGLASEGLEGAGKRLISATYNDMKKRGLELFETSNEGVARVEADRFKELFASQMAVLLIVGHLAAANTLAPTVAEFFVTHPEYEDPRYDFTADGDVDLEDAYQRLAFNEFLTWVVANDPGLHLAVLDLTSSFAAEIPAWDD